MTNSSETQPTETKPALWHRGYSYPHAGRRGILDVGLPPLEEPKRPLRGITAIAIEVLPWALFVGFVLACVVTVCKR